MQSQSDNKFDEFIQSKNEELSFDSSFDKQWDKMAISLEKRAFVRFSLLRFNIYYLSAILFALIGSAVLYFIPNESNVISKESAQKKSILLEKEKKEFSKEGFFREVTVKNKINPSFTKLDSNSQENNCLELQKKETLKDTTTLNYQGNPNSTIVKMKFDSLVKPIVKKIRYITKRDTIITIDTTKVRRKR